MNPLAAAQKRWSSFNQTQKIISIVILVLFVVSIFFISTKLTQQEYVPLLSGLQPQEAGGIIEQLKTMKIPYLLENNGETLLVPKDDVYEVRAELASSGALQGGPGFELFDQSSLGVTDFEQKVDYQRALQGELQRTIVQFEGIEQARVHLVIPEKSLFIEEQGLASASIAVKTKPGIHLKPEQVQGIMDLTIGSIESLVAENVHIIDVSTGEVLSDTVSLSTKPSGSTQYTLIHQQFKREYEQELENRIQKMLNRILGPGKAVAMVTADLDFSRSESTTSTYEDGALLQEETMSESRTGTGGDGGIPGTDTNLPAPPTYATGGMYTEDYEHEESKTNYQPSSRHETIEQPSGRVIRLSTAVVVDGDVTLDQVDEIQTVIAAAVGFNADRGDDVVVTRIPFSRMEIEDDPPLPEPEPSLIPDKYKPYVYIGMGLLGLLLLALVIILMRRRRREEELPEEMIPISELAATEEVPEPEIEEEPVYVHEAQESARKLAKKQPEEVAEIIKVWLSED